VGAEEFIIRRGIMVRKCHKVVRRCRICHPKCVGVGKDYCS